MKRLLIAVLFLFPSLGFANGAMMMADALEQAAGVNLGEMPRELIVDHAPEGIERIERILIHKALDDFKLNLKNPRCVPPAQNCPRPGGVDAGNGGNTEARYCVTRCTGTGKDRVCYEICYED